MSQYSHTTQISKQMHQSKTSITKLLNWNELQYAELQYNSGLQYLSFYIPDDPQGIDMLERNKLFWNWWKNQWAMRDLAFLECPIENLHIQKRISLYLELHDPVRLTAEIYPSRTVLDDSYAQMIGEVFKAEKL